MILIVLAVYRRLRGTIYAFSSRAAVVLRPRDCEGVKRKALIPTKI